MHLLNHTLSRRSGPSAIPISPATLEAFPLPANFFRRLRLARELLRSKPIERNLFFVAGDNHLPAVVDAFKQLNEVLTSRFSRLSGKSPPSSSSRQTTPSRDGPDEVVSVALCWNQEESFETPDSEGDQLLKQLEEDFFIQKKKDLVVLPAPLSKFEFEERLWVYFVDEDVRLDLYARFDTLRERVRNPGFRGRRRVGYNGFPSDGELPPSLDLLLLIECGKCLLLMLIDAYQNIGFCAGLEYEDIRRIHPEYTAADHQAGMAEITRVLLQMGECFFDLCLQEQARRCFEKGIEIGLDACLAREVCVLRASLINVCLVDGEIEQAWTLDRLVPAALKNPSRFVVCARENLASLDQPGSNLTHPPLLSLESISIGAARFDVCFLTSWRPRNVYQTHKLFVATMERIHFAFDFPFVRHSSSLIHFDMGDSLLRIFASLLVAG